MFFILKKGIKTTFLEALEIDKAKTNTQANLLNEQCFLHFKPIFQFLK